MKNVTTPLFSFLLALTLALPAFSQVHHWRGAQQSGAFEAKNLPESWSVDGDNLLWHAEAGSRSAPLVMNDRVYLIGRVGEDSETQERVVCLDLDSGEILWEHRFNAFLTDIVALRLGWANLAGDPETGYIYAHGVQGMFFCFDKDGKVVWKRSLTEEYGRISGYGGRTNTPVIFRDLVIISSLTSGWGPQGKGAHRYWAMDKKSGKLVWWSDPGGKPLDTTYATPVIHDDLLYSAMADGAAVCLDPATGKKVWHVPLSKRGINASVVVANGLAIVGHGEENLNTTTMGSLVALNAKNGSEAWRIDGLRVGYASPVVVDDLIYCPDNSANLFCIDLKTGEQLWKLNYGNEAKGSPVYADGKIYAGEVGGSYHIIKVSREGGEVVHSIEFKEENGSPIEIFGSPVVAHGRVILPNYWDTYCISLEEKSFRSEVPAAVVQAPKSTGGIVPAEITLAAGVTTAFSAPDATSYSLLGLAGEIGEDGTFKSEDTGKVQAGFVVAKAGDVEHKARVRVMPPLPYSENFDDLTVGLPPPGWITSKLKAVVTEVDGEQVLRKLAERPSPPFARLRCYLTPPLESGYTIQSDMLGKAKGRRFIPDMGLINSRYLLIALGTSSRKPALRLTSWAALPRVQKDVPFNWKPDTWYTMKFEVVPQGDSALVRGKVWPQGEDEPEEWSIEMTDDTPNTEGSPGLYGYSVGTTSKSHGTEILYDNVKVFRGN